MAGTSLRSRRTATTSARSTRAIRRRAPDRPARRSSCVRTCIGYGAPTRQNTFEAHGSPLGPDELRAAKADARLAARSRRSGSRRSARPCFRTRLDADVTGVRLGTAHRPLRRRASRAGRGASRAACAANAARRLGRRAADLPGRRRRAGHAQGRRRPCCEGTGKRLPELIGGSADLNPSTLTWLKGAGDFEPPDIAADESRRARRRRLGLRGPQHPLRRARARDGRGGERHGAARRRHPVRRDLPRLLRLHAPARSGSPR